MKKFIDFIKKKENGWHHPDIYLSKSSIHGIGTFTKKAIPKGTAVFVFYGTAFIHTIDDLSKKPWQDRYSFFKCNIPLSDDLWIGDQNHRLKTTYINHSCEPNLVIEGQILVRCYRNIQAKEELCLDYGTLFLCNYMDTVIEKCLCKSTLCRKEITSHDWKIPALQKKYGYNFSIALLKKMGRLI